MQSSRALNTSPQQAWISLWLLRPSLNKFNGEMGLSDMETRNQ